MERTINPPANGRSFLSLHERIRNLLTTINGTDKHQQRPPRNNKSQRSRRRVAFVICLPSVTIQTIQFLSALLPLPLAFLSRRLDRRQTSNNLINIIKHQIHQCIITLQCARHLPPTREFDADLLVHVLAQVEDIFFLWAIAVTARMASTPFMSSSPRTSTTAMLSYRRQLVVVQGEGRRS